MLKQTKGFIAGFITCALLSTLIINVFAAPIEKAITATYNNIQIYVDGNKIEPKDASGNSVEPFMYNGTTYLPVRAVGQAFGKAVEWDGKNNAIYIGKNPNSDTPSIWLDDMDYFNFQSSQYGKQSDWWFLWDRVNGQDNTGSSYGHGLCYKMYGYTDMVQYTEYLLNSKYATFKGNFVLAYGSRSTTAVARLTILGDDNVLYQATVGASVLPQAFNINVSGVIKLKIQIETIKSSSEQYYLGITNAGFYE